MQDQLCLVTGGTGFVGRFLVGSLLKRGARVAMLVRPASRAKFEAIRERFAAGSGQSFGQLFMVAGDVDQEGLGISGEDRDRLQGAEVFHLAAVYDLAASDEVNQRTNVGGTDRTLRLAAAIGSPRFHHVSSIAVAGASWKGAFTESMFAEGQKLEHAYYRTKYEAEALVRGSGLPFRIYRPGLVIGSSQTGEADRIDGIYYTFKVIQWLGDSLPTWFPLVGFEGGILNLVPVDFVAEAIAEIGLRTGRDGRTYHITDPGAASLGDVLNEFCRVARAPQFTVRFDRRAAAVIPREMVAMAGAMPVTQALKRRILEGLRIPGTALAYSASRALFPCDNTQAALRGTGIVCPPLASYSWRIWDHWQRHLDPDALSPANLARRLKDRVVLVTGASSGIGRAVAREVARHGAIVILVARTAGKLEQLRSEIDTAGGTAYVHPTDLSDIAACERMIQRVLAEHGRVDILINNAGRSIRRSIADSYQRFHDFERTMQLNYFGAVRLILEVLPGMRSRRDGHIINISSIGTQAFPPRFGAYVASKAALSALSRCIAPEVADDGVAITNIHMPLVRTPMIAPTGIYRNFPTISDTEAAEMVMSAILSRQPEMGTRLGKAGEVLNLVAPELMLLVMTAAYHIFPDTAGRSEDDPGGQEISPEASALAYVLRGIHF